MKTTAKSSATQYDFSALRELRHQKGLSIADVHGLSGISPAVISKLERNATQPNLDTLHRLARVFHLHPSELMRMAETQSAHRLQEEQHTAGTFRFREVRYGNVRCLHGSAPAGARLSRPEVHGDDYEVCWVLEGKLRFELSNETLELRGGEAIQFDAVFHHAYEAVENSEFLLVRIRKDKRF